MTKVNISPMFGRHYDLGVLDTDGWFRRLGAGLRARILSDGVVRSYPTGALVYAAGDPPEGFFCVISGEVRLVHYASSGKHAFYAIFGPGGWFGALSEIDGLPRFSDAVASADSVVFMLGHGAFQRILREHEDSPAAFLALQCRNLRTTLDMVAEAHALPPRQQVVQILLSLYEREFAGAPKERPARLTQEALAAMAGLSRQTVAKVLHRLRAEGLVDLGYGSVRPTSIAALRAAAREDGRLARMR
ncbi:Crp/Fnr family transcriptional regulator [Chelatococcus reniformis]|nr:Crp/Fnr family transcriptional regulator [Chelatococcus reniformis]